MRLLRPLRLAHPALSSIRAMSTTNPAASKLIFAPGENPNPNPSNNQTPQQAAQFKSGTLHRSALDANPFTQFHAWFSHHSLSSSIPETCTLSTAHLPSGRVSSRMVYLKELDERGFVVYSNWGSSRKASDVETNPHAALCFWWKTLERQVRIEGTVERLGAEESQVYYDTRARGSRVGAWASQQSSVLEPVEGEGGLHGREVDDGRSVLDGQVEEIERRFERQDKIPVPPFWGGLRVVPDMIEFWQGRESRLHDRFRYEKVESGGWKIDRLSP